MAHFSYYHILAKCNYSLERRKPIRLIREILLFFLLPSIVTYFFYFRINQVLSGQTRHADRNATLTKAFRRSWVIWIASWTPAYAGLAVFSFVNPQKYTTFGELLDSIIIYTMQFVYSIQMLHSHINPIFFLLTINDFNEWVTKWTKIIGSFFVCTKHGDLPKPGNRKSQLVASGQLTKTFSFPFFLISFCMVVAGLFLSLTIEANQSHPLSLSINLTTKVSKKIVAEKIKQFCSDADIVKNDDFHILREKCTTNRATYNFRMRRCYFILHHSEPGLNFSAQVSACQIKGAVLSYPRSEEEISFLWDLFERENNHLTIQYFRNFSLHLGLYSSLEVVGTYHSVDNEMVFNQRSQSWFFRKAQEINFSRGFQPLKSPSICIT